MLTKSRASLKSVIHFRQQAQPLVSSLSQPSINSPACPRWSISSLCTSNQAIQGKSVFLFIWPHVLACCLVIEHKQPAWTLFFVDIYFVGVFNMCVMSIVWRTWTSWTGEHMGLCAVTSALRRTGLPRCFFASSNRYVAVVWSYFH